MVGEIEPISIVSDGAVNSDKVIILNDKVDSNVISPNSKKMKMSPQYFNNDLTLLQYLEKNTIGRGILQFYHRHNNLDKNVRSDLVRLIVDGVLARHESLSSNMAMLVSQDIVELFPTETAAAFFYIAISHKKNNGGKLLDRYRNIKKRYRVRSSSPHQELTPNDDIQYKVAWLKTSDSPCQKVESYWHETSSVRMEELKKEVPLIDILKEWPLIKHKLGFSLVSDNFITSGRVELLANRLLEGIVVHPL